MRKTEIENYIKYGYKKDKKELQKNKMNEIWGDNPEEYENFWLQVHHEEEERRRQEEEAEYQWYLKHRNEYDLDYDDRDRAMDLEMFIEEEKRNRENDLEEQWKLYKENEDEGFCVNEYSDFSEDFVSSESYEPPERGYFPNLTFRIHPFHERPKKNNTDTETTNIEIINTQMTNQ